MYRTSNPRSPKYNNFTSINELEVPIESSAGNQALQKLLRNNQELQDRFNEERTKNYDLLELKRRME